MDMGTIAAAASSLKVAGNIAAGLISLKTMADVQSKAIELNQKIIAAQHDIFAANAAQSAFVQRVSDLEKQIAQMKAREEQKKRYKLTNPWEGNPALVYALRASHKDSEAAHWVCTKCYDDGRRSILQPQKDKTGFILLYCPTCKAEIHTGWRGIGAAKYAAD
jgi:rubrerythrin